MGTVLWLILPPLTPAFGQSVEDRLSKESEGASAKGNAIRTLQTLHSSAL
jgi:hypothetical protein